MVDMDKPIMLTATDVMKYIYCPRIIYYVHVLKKPQSVTHKEKKGIEKYDEFMIKGKRTKIVKKYPKYPKMFNVPLISEKLGIKTKIDTIMINHQDKEAYPIQAKYSFFPGTVYKTQKEQLKIEALLIGEWLGYKVPYGFIKYFRSGDLVKISLEDKEELNKVFKSIREILIKETFPEATPYKKRCIDCCFKSFCWGSDDGKK